MDPFLGASRNNDAIRPKRDEECGICGLEDDHTPGASSSKDGLVDVGESEEAKISKGLNCGIKPSAKEGRIMKEHIYHSDHGVNTASGVGHRVCHTTIERRERIMGSQ